MLEIQLVLGFLALFSLWAAVDVVMAPAADVRAMPKPAWTALVVGAVVIGFLSLASGAFGAALLPAMTAMGWLLIGRPDGRSFLPNRSSAAPRRPSSAPRRGRSARHGGPGGGPYGEPVATAPTGDEPISDRRSAELDRKLDEWQARQRRDQQAD